MSKYILVKIDAEIIYFLRKIYPLFARFALFFIFFWFGILKVIGASPASPLVLGLLDKTLPFIDPSLFLILFGLFEVVIGLCFVIPRLERLAIALLFIHLFTTILPLFVMTHLTWAGPFLPTMEGQYIIKNILIAALAVGIASNLQPKRL